MEMGKSLEDVLMSLRERLAPDTELTEDQAKAQDIIFDEMNEQEQALLRDMGSVLLDAIKEFGVDPGAKS